MKSEIIKVIEKHGARILNPEKDIIFPNAETAIIIIDGYSHMSYNKEE